MKWNILKKWMPFLAQQDLIHKIGRGPPGVLLVLSSKTVCPELKKSLVPKVEAPLYNDYQD